MKAENSPWYSIIYYGLEFIGRYYSSYRGFVVDNDDPLNLNRVKIILPTINHLDKTGRWSYPKQSWGGNNYGSNILPSIGDMVWVEFEHGDLNFPLWGFASYGENEKPKEFDSPKKYGFKTPSGHIIIINDIEDEQSILVKHNNLKEYIELLKEKIELEASKIALGKNMDEKAILGETTKKKIEEFIDEVLKLITNYQTHTHTANDTISIQAGTSSSITSSLNNLKTTLVDILSNKVTIDK